MSNRTGFRITAAGLVCIAQVRFYTDPEVRLVLGIFTTILIDPEPNIRHQTRLKSSTRFGLRGSNGVKWWSFKAAC